VAVTVGAVSGWTVATLVYDLGRRRGWDRLVLYGPAAVLPGAVALGVRSPAAYAGSGAAENLFDGPALVGSIAVCRPLLVTVLDAATGGRALLTRLARTVVARLTLVWGLGLLARGTALYAALAHLPIGSFLLVNTAAGWPLTGVGAFLSALYFRRQVGQIVPAGCATMSRAAPSRGPCAA
jgi:hypothetical protein